MVLAPPPGLCGRCRWVRRLTNARGSVFYLCTRSRVDPSYPKYPRLPVLACPAFAPDGPAPAADADAPVPARPIEGGSDG